MGSTGVLVRTAEGGFHIDIYIYLYIYIHIYIDIDIYNLK